MNQSTNWAPILSLSYAAQTQLFQIIESFIHGVHTNRNGRKIEKLNSILQMDTTSSCPLLCPILSGVSLALQGENSIHLVVPYFISRFFH